VNCLKFILRNGFCHFACAQLQVRNFGSTTLDQFAFPKEALVSICCKD